MRFFQQCIFTDWLIKLKNYHFDEEELTIFLGDNHIFSKNKWYILSSINSFNKSIEFYLSNNKNIFDVCYEINDFTLDSFANLFISKNFKKLKNNQLPISNFN